MLPLRLNQTNSFRSYTMICLKNHKFGLNNAAQPKTLTLKAVFVGPDWTGLDYFQLWSNVW